MALGLMDRAIQNWATGSDVSLWGFPVADTKLKSSNTSESLINCVHTGPDHSFMMGVSGSEAKK